MDHGLCKLCGRSKCDCDTEFKELDVEIEERIRKEKEFHSPVSRNPFRDVDLEDFDPDTDATTEVASEDEMRWRITPTR